MVIDRQTERTTLADLERDGALDGMKPYAPTGLCAGIDEEIAAKYPCVHCGGACTYRGFHDGHTYLAFQVCGTCGAAEEF